MHYFWPRYWLIWLGLGLLRLITLLPWHWRIACGRKIGQLLYQLSGQRRHIVYRNITRCFPELSYEQQRQLAKQTFAANGIGIIESAVTWWCPLTQLQSCVTLTGAELIQQAQAKGQGVILAGAHYSTLDLGGILLSHSYPYHATYRPNNNALLDAIIQRGRLRHLPGMVTRDDLRSVVKLLRQGQIVWLAVDQDMGKERSQFAPFFGIDAATTPIISRLARSSGARVLLFSHHRNQDNKTYTLRLNALEGVPSDDPQIDTKQLNKAIEAEVRRCPEQYLWLHRRFKTRPPSDVIDFYK